MKVLSFGLSHVLLVLLLVIDVRAQSDDILSQAGFGTSVAVTGGDVLVGEPFNRRYSGRVYVFRKDSTTGYWSERQVLSPASGMPMDRFGSAIAATDDLAAVLSTAEGAESVAIFRRDLKGQWAEEAILRPTIEKPYGKIGTEVAIYQETVLTTVSTSDGGINVVAFRKSDDGGPWIEAAIPLELPTEVMEYMAQPVLASKDAVFVGAPGESGGAVFVLTLQADKWVVSQTLLGDQSEDASDALFGASLLIHEGKLLIGAPGASDNAGAVHVYARGEDGGFVSEGDVEAFGNDPMPEFGSAMASADGLLLVGAYDSEEDFGHVYTFSTDVDSLLPVQEIRRVTVEDGSEFGSVLAAEGNVAVFGAGADLFGYGSAFVYERDASTGMLIPSDHLRSDLSYGVASITQGMQTCQDGVAAGYACENVDIVSFLSNVDLGSDWGIQTNDVWGWTDPLDGKEYAIICTFASTVFVDISNPEKPVTLGVLPMTAGSKPSWWRDAKVYDNHAYIVADNVGEHGLQIFDLTQLRSVENPPAIFEETAHYDGFDSAHNIIIDEETGFAYVVGINGGGNTCGGGSHILNLANPVEPEFMGCFAHEGTGENMQGATHDAQCVVYHGPDERYTGKEICIAANETAISIADFSDKSNIVPIAVGRYPNVSYAHQGWLTEDHRYFFQNDETDEINGLTAGTRTLVWDLAELDDPVLINEHVSSNGATDHNYYVKGSHMYQSNYTSGLRIFDVSNPEAIEEAGYFDTVPWGEDVPGFGGSWSNYPFFESGVIVVTSGEEGVFFLKRSDVTP